MQTVTIMKLISSLLFVLFSAVFAHGQSAELNIIPKPDSVEPHNGQLRAEPENQAYCDSDAEDRLVGRRIERAPQAKLRI